LDLGCSLPRQSFAEYPLSPPPLLPKKELREKRKLVAQTIKEGKYFE